MSPLVLEALQQWDEPALYSNPELYSDIQFLLAMLTKQIDLSELTAEQYTLLVLLVSGTIEATIGAIEASDEVPPKLVTLLTQLEPLAGSFADNCD